MEPLAAAVVAISTVLATKALEKTGENVGQVIWDTPKRLFLESFRKESPDTVMAIEQAPEQPLDYAEVVLQLETAAKQNPEVAQAMERLVTTVDAEALPNLEEIIQDINKALESHKAKRDNYNIEKVDNQGNFVQGESIHKDNTNIGGSQNIIKGDQTITYNNT
ncbi:MULTISPECIES: hypothetical protein [Moorena]|uniref:Uncharacterized protein n=1 Tax=Moorena producens 3L TaxID=489825 RepID=F4XX04_9CYAN|nr:MULTISPECIES: hypothetical protein [Moorena]EGJ30889.1 hypothetical protein LYNGBM3L_46400 [Moorena producens 3L]NEP64851.1 hypothetical protein [Moorena sp. SIO3A5]OLT66787.1 hypothetical protein BI334_18845 [Moorena producens 3L]